MRTARLAALAAVAIVGAAGVGALAINSIADSEQRAEVRDREPDPMPPHAATSDELALGESFACTAAASGDLTKERFAVGGKQFAAWAAGAAPWWSGRQLVGRALQREKDFLAKMQSEGPSTAACRAAAEKVQADYNRHNPLPAYVAPTPATAEEDRVREAAREGAQDAIEADRATHRP